MNKFIPTLLAVFIQVVACAIIVALLNMLDPNLFSGLLDDRFSGRSQKFAAEDLKFGIIVVFVSSIGLAILGSLLWLVYAAMKVVHPPKDVPARSPVWSANTLLFFLATIVLDYLLVGRFVYGLRVGYTVHVVLLGLLAFLVFYYPATFFATRPTMRPSVLFRNRLFARSQA